MEAQEETEFYEIIQIYDKQLICLIAIVVNILFFIKMPKKQSHVLTHKCNSLINLCEQVYMFTGPNPKITQLTSSSVFVNWVPTCIDVR